MPQKKQIKNQPAKKQKSKKPVLKTQPKILLVGCGKMGEAMLQGWLNAGYKKTNIAFVEKYAVLEQRIKNNYRIKSLVSGLDFNKFNPELIIFAVKPQDLKETAMLFKNLVNSKRVFVSIVAGKTISFFEDILGRDAKVLRIMPNLPASINKAFIIGISNYSLNGNHYEVFERLGYSNIAKEEGVLDKVTALSGSGPAYVFLFMEALKSAGIELGFDDKSAEDIAIMTVTGAAELALSKSDKSLAELRENVTSKGGTTEAALKILMGENGLGELIQKAVKAAEDRAKKLAKEL